MTTVLIIDDDQSLCYSIKRVLEKKYTICVAYDSISAFKQLKEEDIHLVLLDYRLKNENGLDILDVIQFKWPKIPVIMMTAYGTNQTIMKAMRNGAVDYFVKPIDVEELHDSLAKHAPMTICEGDCFTLNTEFEQVENNFIGNSKNIRTILKNIPSMAMTDSSILIYGESGTGKEIIAHLIHQFSQRKDQPFIAVNCAAIPEQLLESELFGYVKGAFTGADKDKKGKFELADKGTLFLDEIGDIPLGLQPKLLRALQEQQVEKVGDTSSTDFDVRIIAASNKQIENLIGENAFRDDLYFRLNVLKINLPALRERLDDIEELLLYFTSKMAKKLNKKITCIEKNVLHKLKNHTWPGNVRELQNVIQRAVIFSTQNCLKADDILIEKIEFNHSDELNNGHMFEYFSTVFEENILESSIKHLEKEIIKGCLVKNKYHLSNTAKQLGTSRVTLNSKIKKYLIHTTEEME